MNKQQLAAKIWESANKMRSKIEANEYYEYLIEKFAANAGKKQVSYIHRMKYRCLCPKLWQII